MPAERGGDHNRAALLGFHVVLRGTGWLVTESGSPLLLRAGDVVLVPYGKAHGLSHTGQDTIHRLAPLELPAARSGHGPADFEVILGCYRLDHSQLHRFLRDLPPVIVTPLDPHRHPERRALIDLLTAEVSRDLPGTGVTRPALVGLVLVDALRHVADQSRPGEHDAGIAATLREIHAEPHQRWTVQRLGEIAGMSRSVFKRRFTAQVGRPPMTYLIEWRLNRGARLLRETKAPLATIARQVGYSSEYAFANAFRRRFGVAPGRFRTRMTS
ncbi:AraC family transcriptional regulator [Actinoplanes sp. NPDC004185]